jgi:hypothetical protein
MLLAGLLVAGSAVAVVFTGDVLGVPEPWPVLLVAGAGLLVGVPRLRHALALLTGVLGGTVSVWLAIAALPASTTGRAAAVAGGVLLITAVSLATGGRLRLSMQLVGLAAAVALAGPAAEGIVTGGVPLLIALARTGVTLLVAGGLGLLVAQVAQLVGTGTVRRGGTAALVALAAGGLLAGGAGLLAPSPARADVTERSAIEHRQTVVRSHAADGTVLGGSVVTRLTVTGDEAVTVVLRDQAVRGLRTLSASPGTATAPSGEPGPVVTGRMVTHRLGPGAAHRTVAQLDRALPVELAIAMTLDDQPIAPVALVGRSGRLTVTYTLTNTTAASTDLRHYDGKGRPRSVTREVAVPFIGDLVVTLDDRFRDVRSPGALVGDGHVRAEVVLAGPVGAPIRTITWSADVRDAVVPPLTVRLVPLALTDPVRGGIELDLIGRATDALRDATDAAGLARTGITALGASSATTSGVDDATLLASTAAILDGLLAAGATAGAELDEVRALVQAQDARVRAGDGLVHGLLASTDVRVSGGAAAGLPPVVHTSVVYVLDVAGRADDGGPGIAVRLVLALGLLVAIGLLGRSVDRLTGTPT